MKTFSKILLLAALVVVVSNVSFAGRGSPNESKTEIAKAVNHQFCLGVADCTEAFVFIAADAVVANVSTSTAGNLRTRQGFKKEIDDMQGLARRTIDERLRPRYNQRVIKPDKDHRKLYSELGYSIASWRPNKK